VKRLIPKSLVGQMAVLIGIALLLAQLASLFFLVVQRQQFSRAQIDAPAITRFTSTAADYSQAAAEFRSMILADASHRGARFSVSRHSSLADAPHRRTDTEERLRQSLQSSGLAVLDARAAIYPRSPEQHSPTRRRSGQLMLLSARLPSGEWLNASLIVPGQAPLLTPELGLATLLLYLFVLSAAIVIAVRLARPLQDLTSAAKAFGGRNEPVAVEPRGPADLRNAIQAFNAMNRRLVDLLEEKDRTLGAIGHDLRTPLASLRIRAESVEPAEDREKMISTIEEMASTLDDILTLARSGRSREQLEPIDLSALATSIAEDYRELGRSVTVRVADPVIVRVQPTLLRRAIRNLVDNALKYAGTAIIDIERAGSQVAIAVLDDGPGLGAEDLGRVIGAFYRGEPSRNRETGGAGLGLSIAQAVADAHGGTLTLSNRSEGGLLARIFLPVGGGGASNQREI
jgi:signal transduction histidine kinase